MTKKKKNNQYKCLLFFKIIMIKTVIDNDIHKLIKFWSKRKKKKKKKQQKNKKQKKTKKPPKTHELICPARDIRYKFIGSTVVLKI